MNMKKSVIEIVKFVGSLAIGVAIGCATRPAVKKLFKLDNEETTTVVPSEDIEDEEVSEEE